MNATSLMTMTELSILILFPTLYSYITAVLLLIALQHQVEVAFTTKLTRIVQLFNANSVVQNAKVKEKAKFHIQKLTQIT
ncbi:hypothetical protein TVAG_545060 [Trichomonas vaginalis G3]|uniref:Uncharacterized protein n=1 Tax=Trichomonas vaginalis (strain ATCC PRA-98 / G3) TaxID=412133 RepID=A2GJ49_TRIV3|nr:hypothetical protein TVAGG3_0976060 [Trichomonas vaginalis G3]EAX82818.1 hypothetical protein TVAG_545060 [Trichomonas vaginalis G3]KAI5488935.1 hypothetical protein TVAGG3_0976060 [Trichomonas vaginalis G3]|eukprot:XP_001295748.1 hypothetical protein [Trichomonas vaginalis G3]